MFFQLRRVCTLALDMEGLSGITSDNIQELGRVSAEAREKERVRQRGRTDQPVARRAKPRTIRANNRRKFNYIRVRTPQEEISQGDT